MLTVRCHLPLLNSYLSFFVFNLSPSAPAGSLPKPDVEPYTQFRSDFYVHGCPHNFSCTKYSCFPCHSPVCSGNAHSTLRCYVVCSSQQHSFQPLRMEIGDDTSHFWWTLKLKFPLGRLDISTWTFPMIPSHLSSWPILSFLVSTGAKDLWHIREFSCNFHWFWLLQQGFPLEQSFFQLLYVPCLFSIFFLRQ